LERAGLLCRADDPGDIGLRDLGGGPTHVAPGCLGSSAASIMACQIQVASSRLHSWPPIFAPSNCIACVGSLISVIASRASIRLDRFCSSLVCSHGGSGKRAAKAVQSN